MKSKLFAFILILQINFFRFLEEQHFSDVLLGPELMFALQNKGDKSVPDVTITQPGFKPTQNTMFSWRNIKRPF